MLVKVPVLAHRPIGSVGIVGKEEIKDMSPRPV